MLDQLLDSLGELATTQVNIAGMLTLAVLVFAIAFLVIVYKRPTAKDETSENDVLRLLIEQFGSISTELRGFAKAVTTDSTETTIEHAEMVSTLKTMNGLLLAVSNGNSDVIKSVDKLTENIGTYTNEAKRTENTIMGTVVNQNEAIQQILESLLRLESRVEKIQNNFDVFQEQSKKFGAEIDKAKSNINAIKDDVSKLTPQSKVTPQGKEGKTSE